LRPKEFKTKEGENSGPSQVACVGFTPIRGQGGTPQLKLDAIGPAKAAAAGQDSKLEAKEGEELWLCTYERVKADA